MNLSNIKALRHKAYLTYFKTLPIVNNKLLFFSNNAMGYSCNPKYLTEYILKNYPDKYDIVWVFSTEANIPELPQGVRIVRYFSTEYLKEISTAKFVICNTRIPPYFMFKKRKGQYYIQTWHGSLALKVIEEDAKEYLSETYQADAKFDSSQIDLIPASSAMSADQYKTGFWYGGEVMECGTPRCDIFFDKDKAAVFKQKYGIDADYKVLLYAPTFRNNREPNIFGIDFNYIKKRLCEATGDKWKVIFKLHPNLSNIDYKTDDPDIVNIDSKADLQELLVVADILITDYSSCMFDMGLMRKPCVIYAPDLDDYIANERKMYFDIRSLPFPLAETNAKLAEVLTGFSKQDYQNALDEFLDKIGNFEDGRASERIEKYISNKCFGKGE